MTDQGKKANVAQVVLETRDNIAYITFDHVAARNAMTVDMYQSLKSICEGLAKNSGYPSLKPLETVCQPAILLGSWHIST